MHREGWERFFREVMVEWVRRIYPAVRTFEADFLGLCVRYLRDKFTALNDGGLVAMQEVGFLAVRIGGWNQTGDIRTVLREASEIIANSATQPM